MDNDYLWNKSGTDHEIEKLENALSMLRYKATDPPAVKMNIRQPAEKLKVGFLNNFFRFAVPAIASLAIAVTIVVFWRLPGEIDQAQIGNNSTPLVTTISFEIPKQGEEIFRPKLPSVLNKKLSEVDFASKRTFNNRSLTKVSIRIPQTKEKEQVKLTAEEKDAYEQLMLALSITGSRLKEVKEKVEGNHQDSGELDSLR